MITEELLVFNGINGDTGNYLLDPIPADELGNIALGHRWWSKSHLVELENRDENEKQGTYALLSYLNASKLDEAGWGAIFPHDADPKEVQAIRDALKPLLDYRKEQAGERFKVYFREADDGVGYVTGMSKDEFLREHGVGPGEVDPKYVPFYLLIVGDPQSIPYVFQYELDVQYAVGRIHFDRLEEYAYYAQSVVEAETGGTRLPRKAVFFGVVNEGDRATEYSANMLIKPLAEFVNEMEFVDENKNRFKWETELVHSEDASKSRLEQLLGGNRTPAFLFSASHGLGFTNGSEKQERFQGALLCDTDGPIPHGSPIERKYYMAAEDISSDNNLLGMISFTFACYGAGTPHLDDYFMRISPQPSPIAPHAFLAPLPKRLLSHPRGGALAVVGHVDRAWSYSFRWKDTGAQTSTFKSALYDLLTGKRLGDAMDSLNRRYAEIATMLSNAQSKSRYKKLDSREIAGLWTANNDARGFTIVGDPAVRLPVVKGDQQTEDRPVIEITPSVGGPVKPVLVPQSMPGYEESNENTEDAADLSPKQPPHQTRFEPTQTYGVAIQSQTVLHGWVAMGELVSKVETDELDYAGAGDIIKQVYDKFTEALKDTTAKLAEFAHDTADLEVETYVSDDIENVTFEKDNFGKNATKRAITNISLLGDTRVCVPIDAGELDETLWAIHNDMVNQAFTNRMQMIKAVAEILASLTGTSA